MANFNFTRGLTQWWWMPLITGLICVAIGVWCLCSPIASLETLALAFAFCIILAGILNFSFAFANIKRNSEWGWSLAIGVFEILIGIWLYCLPANVLLTTFIYTVGIYLIFVTINAICATCSLYSTSSDWTGWLLAFLLCTLIFAIIFIAGPIAGGVAVWLYIGISFISYGIFRIILACKLLRINKMMK